VVIAGNEKHIRHSLLSSVPPISALWTNGWFPIFFRVDVVLVDSMFGLSSDCEGITVRLKSDQVSPTGKQHIAVTSLS
jgi:hypothetical protein